MHSQRRNKINISIIGNGFIASCLIKEINEYNKKDDVNQITIDHILVRNPSRYNEVLDNMTTNIQDLLDGPSNVIIDLTNNTDFSLSSMPKFAAAGKSILVANKILLSEHGKTIFDIQKQYGVKVLIGACLSADSPIHISPENPLYVPGKNYLEKRGNSSDQICAAIFEELLYFYKQ